MSALRFPKKLFLLLVFLLLGLEAGERIIDFVAGDGNGEIIWGNISYYITLTQSFLVILFLNYWFLKFTEGGKDIKKTLFLNQLTIILFLGLFEFGFDWLLDQ